MDVGNEMQDEAEAVNAAEEWLIRARRVGRLIRVRVKAALDLGGAPTLHAPGVEPPFRQDE